MCLHHATQGTIVLLHQRIKSISENLHGSKSISDELDVINSPLDVDQMIHTLNGLRPENKEVSTAIRTRENPTGFDPLHDILVDHEGFLKRDKDNPLNAISNVAYRRRSQFHKCCLYTFPTPFKSSSCSHHLKFYYVTLISSPLNIVLIIFWQRIWRQGNL